MTRLFTLNGRPWFSSKPSKKVLAAEIDRLNAALSNAGNIQAKTEKLWTMAEENVTVLGRSLARANQKLEKYDESALAEARRLAVLQIFGGYAHNLNEAAEWLATGVWDEVPTDIAEEELDADTAAYVESGFEPANPLQQYLNGFAAGKAESEDPWHDGATQQTAYAHGWVRGWNELLDTIQRHWVSTLDEVPGDRFENLRQKFNRTEAM